MMRTLAMCACMAALVGCTKPQPPDKEQPPEPQATQLREAIDEPIDKARDAQKAIDDAAASQDAAIDAAGG